MKIVWRVTFTILRIWMGLQWLEAGSEKIKNPAWVGDQVPAGITGFLKGAAAKATGAHPAVQKWYADFLNGFAIPNAKIFSYMVAFGEALVGIALILGIFTTFAALMGAFMNLNFMLAGSTSTNPILYTGSMIILFWSANATFFALDHVILPWLKERVQGILKKAPATAA